MGQRATISQSAPAPSLGDQAASARESATRHLLAQAEPDQFAEPQAYADSSDFWLFATADVAFLCKIARDTLNL